MKIVQVCAHPDTPMVVAYLAAALARRGHSVDLVVPAPGALSQYFTEHGGTCHFIPIRSSLLHDSFVAKRWVDFQAGIGVRARLVRGKYHLAHMHLLRAEVFGKVFGVGLPIRMVSTMHGIYEDRAYSTIQKATRWRDDAVVAVSKMVRDYAIHNGWPKEKIRVIHNHLPFAEWDLIPNGRKAIRRELGIPLDVPVLGLVGRLLPHVKGHEIYLRAVARVAKRYPDVKALVVGSEPNGQSTHTARLMQLAADLGIRDRCLFVGERRDIPSIMDAIDVLAVPSLVPEAFGMVILEAMARGTPVVASDIGGIPEVVLDGETGLLVPPNDDEALARAVCFLLSRPDVAIRVARTARNVAAAKFDTGKAAISHEELYQSLVEYDIRN